MRRAVFEQQYFFRSPSVKLVKEHLRAIEDGNWDLSLSYLSEDYVMTSLEPFPIRKDHALDIHKARKAVFPDFKFNEEISINRKYSEYKSSHNWNSYGCTKIFRG